MTRRRGQAVLVAVVAAAAAAAVAAEGTAPGPSADAALQKLMDGNQRYVDGALTNAQRSGAASRRAVAQVQKPYAVVLTCSDSRVPPELLFDQGLGEIFVVRVAGNVADPVTLGSIEYAAEHLGAPLVMVLGHERCGAVKATVEAKGKGEGNLGSIVQAIAPRIPEAAHHCPACQADQRCQETRKDEFVECVADVNAQAVAAHLTEQSAVLQHLAEQRKLKIVTAKYDLDDGKVTLLR